MRNFFKSSLIALALILGATGAAPVAHAAFGDACTANGISGFQNVSGECVANGSTCETYDENIGALNGTWQNGRCISSGTPVVKSASASGANNITDFSSGDKDNEAYNGVMQRIMILFAWLVGVAAITLDNAVYYTVVAMGTYIHDLSAIGVTWRILRDIGNIMLIFGFLAIGITTILNVDWYGDRKKMIPNLIIAAVFLNFSLFFAEAIIDAGNLFATQFYTQINGGQVAGAKNFDLASVGNDGIANKIMSQLGLQTIYGQVRTDPALLKGASSWVVGFMGILLFIVTAFVMFSLAFILIARFIFLIFLIILAPVGFAGLAVPQLAGRAKQWWDALFQQTLIAPVLLLMLYVALAVITDAKFLTGLGGSSASWTGFADGKNLTGFGSMILSFLVAMGLLIAVTIAAKKLSAFGAIGATKLASIASFGATAWAGRAVGGGLGRGLNSRWVRSQASKSTVGGFAAKTAAFTGRRLENRTYDIRNANLNKLGIGGKLGDALGGAPFGVSTGVAAGSEITAKKAYETVVEKVGQVKPFSGDWWRDTQKEYEKAAAERERDKNLATPGTPDFAKAINKMSDDELAELKGIRQGLESFVGVLSPAKYATLSKSPKLLAGEKKKLGQAWDNQFAVVTPPGGGAPINNAAATIGRFNTEEVAGLSGSVLTKPNVVEVLGNTELDAIRRKGSLNKQQRHDIFDQMTSPAASPALAAVVADYFLPANDPGGSRLKYWNV